MRQAKRIRSPGVWLSEFSWVESRKRQKRDDSNSSVRENKSRRRQQPLKTHEGHYLETHSLNQQRIESKDRRAREASLEMGYGEDNRAAATRDRDREREKDKEWHHYSKSSGRSGKSGRSSRRGRRRSPSHQRSSYSVWEHLTRSSLLSNQLPIWLLVVLAFLCRSFSICTTVKNRWVRIMDPMLVPKFTEYHLGITVAD